MITFRQVEAFKALMEAGTVVKAAETMGLSQPAVSRLVADLEAGIGYSLFDRRKGQLAVRAEAQDLYAEVERAFVGLSTIVDAAGRIGHQGRTRLRVAAIPGLCIGFLPKVIAALLDEEPDTLITLEVRSRLQILKEVGSGRHDLGLAGSPLEATDVSARIIARPDFVCVVPLQHPLAKQDAIEAEDLDGVDLIVAADRTPLARQLDRRLHGSGTRPTIRAEVTSAHSAFAMAAAGIGVVVSPRPFLYGHALQDLQVIEFRPRFEFELGLFHQAEKPPIGVAARFVELCIEALAEPAASGRRYLAQSPCRAASRVG